MAYNAFAGSFNIDSSVTAGNDQSVTGVGFQPKIVLFWWSGSTATGDSVAGGTIQPGVGAAISSSSRWFVIGISIDAAATSDAYTKQGDTACIYALSDAAGTVDGIADFKSMDADGFTLTIDNQFSVDYRISFLALGGTDLTDVYLGNQQTPGSTGNYNVTGVGFQPDALITASAWTGGMGWDTNSIHFSIGMATGSSNQGACFNYVSDGQATSNTFGYGYNGECNSGYSSLNIRESFVSFGADGFTLNHLEGATQRYFVYACLKGGQYLVGDLTTRTDGNDIEEDVGFPPAAVLFFSTNRALSTQDTVTDHARLSIGAATATDERTVQAISDEDNLADTETAYTNQDDAVYAHVKDDAIEALMDIKSFDADGFTCVMDDTETSACWVTYLAIGAAAAGDLSISKNESLIVTSTISLGGVPNISASESITAADSPTALLADLVISSAEGLTVSDSILADVLLLIGEAESLTVSDSPTIAALQLALAVAETVTASDAAILALSALALSVSDSLTISESQAQDLLLAFNVSDSVSLSDAATVGPLAIAASASDSVIVSDTPTINLALLILAISEALTVSDSPTVSTGAGPTLSIGITSDAAAYRLTGVRIVD